MAESILRLKVSSAEYDNKLKQAVNGLLRMEAECRKVGGTLGVLEKDQLEYVKSLGQMETKCKTARGSLRELKNAYLNFYQIYKRMSDEEKRDRVRKELQERGIQTSVHYPAIHRFSAYKDYCKGLPKTEYASDNEITLPMYAKLTYEQIKYISSCLKEILSAS